MVIGWVTSVVLYMRLRRIPARSTKTQRPAIDSANYVASLLADHDLYLFQGLFAGTTSIFLPTYMTLKGSNLLLSAGALSIWELAGVGGALAGGTLSDRLGRKIILLVGLSGAIVLTIIFLNVSGWLLVPVLLALGFFSLSGTPVLFAIVQEHLPDNRAVGSGIFIAMNFLARPVAILVIGLLGDNFGLGTAYFWGAIISVAAIPAIYFLPELKNR